MVGFLWDTVLDPWRRPAFCLWILIAYTATHLNPEAGRGWEVWAEGNECGGTS